MLWLTGFLGLARIPLCFWAHTDLTDPTVLLCGWKISQMFLRVGWLARSPLCFWAHTDLTDPTVLLCGWEISQMVLWVGLCVALRGHIALALTDLFFGPIGQIRPIGPISYRTDWTLKK